MTRGLRYWLGYVLEMAYLVMIVLPLMFLRWVAQQLRGPQV